MKKFVLPLIALLLVTSSVKLHSQSSLSLASEVSIVPGDSVSVNCAQEWVKLNKVLPEDLTAVRFLNNDTGFVADAYGVLYKTTNAGKNWKSVGNTGGKVKAICFVSKTVGFTVGFKGVFKTINGGNTWTPILQDQLQLAYGICFPDSVHGYLVSTLGNVFKTSDGGNSWTPYNCGTNLHLTGVSFADALNGCVISPQGAFFTHDGGLTWEERLSGSNALIAVSYPSAKACYVAGVNTFFKSVDSGLTWKTTTPPRDSVYSMSFLNDSFGYAVGSVVRYGTKDGGETWYDSEETRDGLEDVNFAKGKCYCVGHTGTIYKLDVMGSFKWSPAKYVNNIYIQNPTFKPDKTTTYKVTYTSLDGSVTTDSVKVVVKQYVSNSKHLYQSICGGTVNIQMPKLYCIDIDKYPKGTNFDDPVYNGVGVPDAINLSTTHFKYKWSPANGVSNDTIPNPVITAVKPMTYHLSITTPNGIVITDSLSIEMIAMDQPEIGMVSITPENKNMLVWNYKASTGIASYLIYRETKVTNIYEKIGQVSADSACVFVDSVANPDEQSNKYALALVDKIGLESLKSNAHKTMHLSINKGINTVWNLIWEPYEGFVVSTYNIYRGSDPKHLTLIGSTSGSATQFSDLNAPSGNVYYQLEVINPKTITPDVPLVAKVNGAMDAKSAQAMAVQYNASRSNIAFSLTDGVTMVQKGGLEVYPKLVSDVLTIKYDGSAQYQLFNSVGKLVAVGCVDQRAELSVSNLPKGLYFVKIDGRYGIETVKIIKK